MRGAQPMGLGRKGCHPPKAVGDFRLYCSAPCTRHHEILRKGEKIMSDYSQHNQGIGGKGIVVGLLLIGLFVAGLAFLGANGSEVEPGTAVIDPASPVAEPEPAPAITE